jgi:ADP-dependent NAD(P)H-hydrate dehydratase / NAD(P)H-hydrate epimerase
VRAAAAKAGALALGPGLGRGEEAGALVRSLLEELELPAVVDADALYGLRPVERRAPTVLTPHAGELARLLGRDAAWVSAHRLEAAVRAAEDFGAVVLLKGADTLVAAPGQGLVVRRNDAPGLATAGTGDVLTGAIAAFLAKGLAPDLAAAAGATAHGLAAALAPRQEGMVASDVASRLPEALALHR